MTDQPRGRSVASTLLALLVASAVCGSLPALAASEKGPTWASLTPAQQQVLAPLQRDWPTLESNRRQKWLEMASRFPSMQPDERRRVQERMAEWVRMTPAERTQARLRFQEVRQLPAEERNAKWQAYQALPEEERKTLAQRAVPASKAASGAASAVGAEAAGKPRTSLDTSAKRPVAALAAASAPASRAVAPIVVQARPGATTTTMSVRALPPQAKPAHGAPKIAATSSYVDPATLLPRRSPHTAALPASASDNSDQP